MKFPLSIEVLTTSKAKHSHQKSPFQIVPIHRYLRGLERRTQYSKETRKAFEKVFPRSAVSEHILGKVVRGIALSEYNWFRENGREYDLEPINFLKRITNLLPGVSFKIRNSRKNISVGAVHFEVSTPLPLWYQELVLPKTKEINNDLSKDFYSSGICPRW